MNITEFLDGEEITIYANKRFEKVTDEVLGKGKMLLQALAPSVALIIMDLSMGNNVFGTYVVTILSIVYLTLAVMYSKTTLRKLNKKSKLSTVELEELASENSKAEFLHENIPYNFKSVEQFEKTLQTIKKYRNNVTFKTHELDIDSLVLYDKHQSFENVLFKDEDTQEEFLVSTTFKGSEQVGYAEYPVDTGILFPTQATLKTK